MIGSDENPSQLVIERTIDAPLNKVWRAWSDPVEFKKWWGPKDFTTPTCTMDFQVEGTYFKSIRNRDGKEMFNTGTFTEIIPMERISYMDSFADKNGNIVSSDAYELAGFPTHLHVTVLFEIRSEKTKITLIHTGIPHGEMTEMTAQGWQESFDKLQMSLL